MDQRQVHFRVTDTEYQFLQQLAHESDQSVAQVLRRMLRRAMHAHGFVIAKSGTAAVPDTLSPRAPSS